MGRRLASAEEEVVQVRRKSAEQFHMRDKLLRKLDDKATKHSIDINELISNQKADIEHLNALQSTLAPLLMKTRQQSADEGDQPGDSALTFDQELKELRETTASQKEQLDKAQNKLDMVAHLLDSLKLKEQRDVDTNSSQITGLQEELGDAHTMLSKLDARVEMVQKYFTGLSRGLQDTHSVLTGDSSALPQKNVKQLPTLPNTTPRTALMSPSPRKPSRNTLFGRQGTLQEQ